MKTVGTPKTCMEIDTTRSPPNYETTLFKVCLMIAPLVQLVEAFALEAKCSRFESEGEHQYLVTDFINRFRYKHE